MDRKLDLFVLLTVRFLRFIWPNYPCLLRNVRILGLFNIVMWQSLFWSCDLVSNPFITTFYFCYRFVNNYYSLFPPLGQERNQSETSIKTHLQIPDLVTFGCKQIWCNCHEVTLWIHWNRDRMLLLFSPFRKKAVENSTWTSGFLIDLSNKLCSISVRLNLPSANNGKIRPLEKSFKI